MTVGNSEAGKMSMRMRQRKREAYGLDKGAGRMLNVLQIIKSIVVVLVLMLDRSISSFSNDILRELQ